MMVLQAGVQFAVAVYNFATQATAVLVTCTM